MADEGTIKPAKRGGGDLAGTGAHILPKHIRQVSLPPAGYKRDEEMLKRTDDLAQKVEEHAGALNAHAFDPHRFDPDPDILANIDGFEVTDKQPGFRYKWVPFDNPTMNKGLMVRQAEVDGWRAVCGTDPEAKGQEIVGGMRKIGDTILMKISEEKFLKIEARERRLAANLTGAVNTDLIELGKRKGITIKPLGEVGDHLLKSMSARDRGALAAQQQYDQALRDGTLKL